MRMRSQGLLDVMRSLLLLALVFGVVGTGCATAQSSQKTSHASLSKKKHHSTSSKKAVTAAPSDDTGDDTGEDNSGDDNTGDGEDLSAVAASEGGASFYHDSLTGHLTANGEKYDPDESTCAHRSLPFGTLLVIEDVATGKKARCRVNDRGPYADGRIVDVSKRVAKDLGMLDRGVIRVRIRVAKQPTAS